MIKNKKHVWCALACVVMVSSGCTTPTKKSSEVVREIPYEEAIERAERICKYRASETRVEAEGKIQEEVNDFIRQKFGEKGETAGRVKVVKQVQNGVMAKPVGDSTVEFVIKCKTDTFKRLMEIEAGALNPPYPMWKKVAIAVVGVVVAAAAIDGASDDGDSTGSVTVN